MISADAASKHSNSDPGMPTVGGAPKQETSTRKHRQTASRKLNRTAPVSFRMTPDDLKRIKAAAERDGLGQSDWLSTAIEAVLRRGMSPIAYAKQAELKDVHASLVNLANAHLTLQFALGLLDRTRATDRRKAMARDALAHCQSILRSTRRRLA